MKKTLWVLVILALAFSGYWFIFKAKNKGAEEPKVAALTVSKHSGSFNKGIDSLVLAYLELTSAFVETDSIKAKAAAEKLILMADTAKLSDLKKDTSGIFESAGIQMNDIKANAESLVKQPNITEMRQDFRMVSESLYPLLKTVGYEGNILYWQNCPMAFGENNGASWLSMTREIVNPYMGKKNPEYKSGMLHCGEIKDSIIAH